MVVNDNLMEEFDEFKASTVEPGVIMLPSCDLLQYWITKEKKRPLNNTVMRFGSPYVRMSANQVDDLCDWVYEPKRGLSKENWSSYRKFICICLMAIVVTFSS